MAGTTRVREGFDRFLRHPLRWWGLIAFWFLVAAASYSWRLHELTNHAFEMARQRGQLVFEMVETTRTWSAQHGGVYAPVTTTTPPNPYLDVPEKVITTPSGKTLTKINPAYMTRQLGELIAQGWDLRIHLTSLNPINPGNTPDDWERIALEAFETSRDPRVATMGSGGEAVFRYMAPLEVKQACLACHAKQGYKLGDVRGGLSVTFPARYVLDIIDAHKRDYLIIHAVVFLLLSGVTWLALAMIRNHVLALEAARNDLVASEKMASLGRMVAGFAHEVNTPLGIAVGGASQLQSVAAELRDLLAQDEVEESEVLTRLALLDEDASLLQANLRRATGMVQSFKRTAVDQESEALRDFALAEMIDDVQKNLRSAFKQTAIRISCSCPQELRQHGPAGALEQVLTNLLENARIHAFADGARPGNIHIAVVLEQTNVSIEVRDDGAGMSPESVARAFEPFYTTRRNKGGSGLGLFIVYSLVTHKLGGSIECTSQPGQGTVFRIRFPYRPPQDQP